MHLFTDASGSQGFGAIFKTHWFSGTWPEGLKHFQITLKELFPIVLALEIWGPLLRNQCLIFHSDNEAVVHIINKQSSKDKHIMCLVRRLILSCMSQNVLIKSVHIPGKVNVLPDLLSRLQVNRFKDLAPHMDVQATEIPIHLLKLL